MKERIPRRVVVTGMGVVCSIGCSLAAFEEGLFRGRCGIGHLSLFDTRDYPCRAAAEVRGGDFALRMGRRLPKRVSRCDLLGLAAAEEAFSNSGLDLAAQDRERIGVVLGGGAGGMLSWEGYRRARWAGRKAIRASRLLASSPCTLADLLGSRWDLGGFRTTITTACSSSATAIGHGFDLIRQGIQDVVLTGGSESLSELTFAGFNALRLMDPLHCRPFDRNRQGLSLGEGAAILVLEEREQALSRGARIYGEVLGYAINSDAYHMTSPDPGARGMRRVMEAALATAGLLPDQVDYINAHGTGTKINDAAETRAVKAVFGVKRRQSPAVSSTKSMVGHCLGAAGALEAAATLLALYRQLLPPTVHLESPDEECDLDHVPNQARPTDVRFALSNSFAFGGNNTCLVFGREGAGAPSHLRERNVVR
ncbi:MAG: beta-ketoacyl-[acyl-carrier-protein] synthase family protein [Deltaproteobacteria bacterium]|nr:beta-ketoacyl-[acyl-carrier-protein] synthase family protein [Deltaproteobacteria bacterium]MBW2303540.1 beta-ketoacyl-[acyl-carrier-protein] synthase family protein [Deltaproteobacteria bacterium]